MLGFVEEKLDGVGGSELATKTIVIAVLPQEILVLRAGVMHSNSSEAATEEAMTTFESPFASAGQNDADGGVQEGSRGHFREAEKGRTSFRGSSR